MNAFDTAPAKAKLNNLQAHMPEADEYIVLFARYLATYLNPELVPVGWVMGNILAVHALEEGTDDCTGIPIDGAFRSLTGMPPVFYSMLTRLFLVKIAQAVLTQEQAEAVEAEFKAVFALGDEARDYPAA